MKNQKDILIKKLSKNKEILTDIEKKIEALQKQKEDLQRKIRNQEFTLSNLR